ncbi:hypothetical protein [Tessaracoccus lapidicaptus]|uniref:hypothetical protein n=1 Tax=Tessaracoccus lapidicaptus TaxID=1427523 RepID=UPI003342BFE8
MEWLAIFVLALVRAGWVLTREPVLSGDTPRYWNPADPLHTLRFDLGQGPGQLVQMIYLLPMNAATGVQALLAALVWGWACVVASRGLARWWFWIALAFSLSPWWLLWDNRLVTESITLAAMALFAAGAFRWVKEESATPMVAGAVIALLARPLTVPLVAVILVLVVVARGQWPRPRWSAMLLGALLVFAGVQAVAFNRAPVNYHWLPLPLQMEAVRAGDRFVSRSHVDGYVALAERHGMPDCAAAVEIPRGIAGLTSLWTATCPEMVEWLKQGGLPWQAELLENPGPTLREVAAGNWLLEAWGGDALQDRGWQSLREVARTWWWPAVRVMNLVMWTVLAVSVVWLARPGDRWTLRASLATAAVGFAAALGMFDGLEMWRHLLPALVTLAPAALASTGARVQSTRRLAGNRLRASPQPESTE